MKQISILFILSIISLITMGNNRISITDTTNIFRGKTFIKNRITETSDLDEIYKKGLTYSDYNQFNDFSNNELRKQLDLNPGTHYRKLISKQYETPNYTAVIILYIGESIQKQYLTVVDSLGKVTDDIIIHGRISTGPQDISDNKVLWYSKYHSIFEKNHFTVIKKSDLSAGYEKNAKRWSEIHTTRYEITPTGKIKMLNQNIQKSEYK